MAPIWPLALQKMMAQAPKKLEPFYIFRRVGTVWLLEQEISNKSSGFTALLANDEFGTSLSLDGSYLRRRRPL